MSGCTPTIARPAPVAQWIEQPPPKRKVAGSTPAWGTTTNTQVTADLRDVCAGQKPFPRDVNLYQAVSARVAGVRVKPVRKAEVPNIVC